MANVKGECFTNLDDYDTSNVKEFYRVPNVGERVACLKKGHRSTLRVVQITHDVKNNEPFIVVELHN